MAARALPPRPGSSLGSVDCRKDYARFGVIQSEVTKLMKVARDALVLDLERQMT
jgi:hypothetical protein